MKFKKKSVFTLKKERSREDNYERSGLKSKMSITSTPIKSEERRSVSLLDISEIPSLQRTKINVSNDSLGSTSSICKDSGYHQSEGSLVSDKIKDGFGIDYRQEYFRLLDDLKFKDVLISSLHESNHNLRMKIAEAENKISELRFKSQTHCRCCSYRTEEGSLNVQNSDRSSTRLRYSLSTFARSEPCLLISSPPRIEKSPIISPKGEAVALPADDAFSKVEQWQKSVENLTDRQDILKPIVIDGQCAPIATSQNNNSDSPNAFLRHPPESLPKSMSYMETSRALAEVYRRKQEKMDIFSFQLIGDHSVSVSPVQLVQMNQNSKFEHCKDGYKVSSHSSKKKSSKEASNLIHEKQKFLTNLQFKNQKTASSSLKECLEKACEYSSQLTLGLSRVATSLEEIRSISDQVVFS